MIVEEKEEVVYHDDTVSTSIQDNSVSTSIQVIMRCDTVLSLLTLRLSSQGIVGVSRGNDLAGERVLAESIIGFIH
jgi:hypothetical protein